jgi:GDPmannose 4,6-dehydratase
MSQKVAMITGVTGQDGGYLATLLLKKGYRVIGLHRRGATNNFSRLKEMGILENIELVGFDLLEFSNICRILKEYQPDEFYNLAAQSFVATSWTEPIYTVQADGLGVVYILEAIKDFSPNTKFFQASTSEMFGKVQNVPQTETTSFCPRNPYGCAKVMAHWMTMNYGDSFGVFACAGILYNHESPMRGKAFVTRKITDYFARLALGLTTEPLELGNLNAKRDWGFAGDYVEGMWLMLQQEKPDTYIFSTGKAHPIRDFATLAGKYAGFDIEWHGEGINEIGIDRKTGNTIVKVNPEFFRPAEDDILLGDPSKAEKVLGWKRKVSYEELCRIMVEKDIERYKKEMLNVNR